MKKTDSLSKKIFTLFITSLNRRCETSTGRFELVRTPRHYDRCTKRRRLQTLIQSKKKEKQKIYFDDSQFSYVDNFSSLNWIMGLIIKLVVKKFGWGKISNSWHGKGWTDSFIHQQCWVVVSLKLLPFNCQRKLCRFHSNLNGHCKFSRQWSKGLSAKDMDRGRGFWDNTQKRRATWNQLVPSRCPLLKTIMIARESKHSLPQFDSQRECCKVWL